ncbi:hypothetical protein M8J76_017011 [Diaphorina citri]|nr:hypothetical protein M8J76_017011 [Diaphorina citri]
MMSCSSLSSHKVCSNFSMVTDLFSGVIPDLGESEEFDEEDGKDAPESDCENEDLVGEIKLGDNEELDADEADLYHSDDAATEPWNKEYVAAESLCYGMSRAKQKARDLMKWKSCTPHCGQDTR